MSSAISPRPGLNKIWLDCLLSLILILSSGPLFGQLNESDSAAFQLACSATGYVQTGNVRFYTFSGSIEALLNGNQRLVAKSQNQTLYQAFAGVVADNDLLSRNYLYLDPYKRFYPFAIVFVQTNLRRKVDLRYFGGVGYTFQAVRNSRSNVKLSVAGFYEQTSFDGMQFSESAYNGDSRISLLRATAYLNGWHMLLDQRIHLSYSAYVQPSLDGIANTRLQAMLACTAQIAKGLNFRIQYLYRYEQVVIEGVQKTDGILTLGLSYQFLRK